jgi:hypothetical protein
VYGESAEFGKSCLHVLQLCRLMSYVRYDGTQEWVCPHIVLPKSLAKCKDVFDEVAARARPRHTAEWQPVFSECRVELFFNKKKISITCDAVVATILSLFETPETVVRQSEIEAKTGVKGNLLSAVMEQLCMKRQREGMATGLLQVP